MVTTMAGGSPRSRAKSTRSTRRAVVGDRPHTYPIPILTDKYVHCCPLHAGRQLQRMVVASTACPVTTGRALVGNVPFTHSYTGGPVSTDMAAMRGGRGSCRGSSRREDAPARHTPLPRVGKPLGCHGGKCGQAGACHGIDQRGAVPDTQAAGWAPWALLESPLGPLGQSDSSGWQRGNSPPSLPAGAGNRASACLVKRGAAGVPLSAIAQGSGAPTAGRSRVGLRNGWAAAMRAQGPMRCQSRSPVGGGAGQARGVGWTCVAGRNAVG